MSTPKKLRGGSESELTKLKHLARDKQEVIWSWREELVNDKPLTNTAIRNRIATQFGIRLSRDGQLSEFWGWYSRRMDLETTNDLLDQFEEFVRVKNKDWSADRVRDTAIQFFMAHTAAKKDVNKFATIVTLDQNERFAKTKAAQKERQLDQQDRKIRLLEKKAEQLDRVKEVVESTLTPEQQKQRLKEILA